jgi:hypothetical protein
MRIRAVLAGAFLLALFVGSAFWTVRRFSYEGRMEALFSGVIWGEQIEEWDDPPVDVSSKVCPLVDEAMRAEMLEESPQGEYQSRGERVIWSSGFGGRCLSQERVLIIQISPIDRSCRAGVDVPPPRCAF